MELILDTDPGSFLERAADHLAARPVLNTVLASTAIRSRDALDRGRSEIPPDSWFCTVLGPPDPSGESPVVGLAMRTGPLPDHACYLLPMPEEAAVLLARLLHERGEPVSHANGALPAVRRFAEETARLTGRAVQVGVQTRLFELHRLTAESSDPAPGRLRTAGQDDLGLVTDWLEAFAADADAQAGRPPGTRVERIQPDVVRGRIEDGRILLWDHRGPVHLTGVNPVSFGVQRVGPVFTPPAERGRGYARAAVREVSRRILAAGARPCLFTDQANPTSNRLYLSLGYTPVVDMVNLVLA